MFPSRILAPDSFPDLLPPLVPTLSRNMFRPRHQLPDFHTGNARREVEGGHRQAGGGEGDREAGHEARLHGAPPGAETAANAMAAETVPESTGDMGI